MQSKSQQFVFHTPNLTITTVANKVRSISNLKRFTEPFELCGGEKTNSFLTNRVLSHSQFIPEIIHQELQGEDCTCPDCHGQLKEIGSTVQRQELVFIPAQLKRIDHVQRPHHSPEIQSEGAQLPSGKRTDTSLVCPSVGRK
ncbi:TPA: IS66 family transposase zinc-finger binding domain-containing protein [Streptococcus suis]|nr:IS66 family transposase zinc-finger binding domain-containing protein [Streptococcus suis]HEL9645753.1 IS66 family transposase zinc-finger binding domain-containing protein [Streptococcus suis]